MAGNSLGPREWIKYTSDEGTIYAIETDADIAAAVGGAPPASGTPNLPRRFKPRRLHLKSASGLRKSVIIPDPTNETYADGGNMTIDSVVFVATGRTGESKSFPNF